MKFETIPENTIKHIVKTVVSDAYLNNIYLTPSCENNVADI